MKRKGPEKRGSRPRKIRPLVLIICEGETEKEYLDGFRKEYRLTATQIQISVEGVPLTVVKKARDRKNADGGYKAVWAVFDRDDHPNIPEACDMAKQNDIKVAYSNPAFEIWYLLHVKDQTAFIDRDEAERMVRRAFPGWNKPASLFDETAKDRPTAIKRAAKGRKRHSKNGSSEDENPSTTMDQLVQFLETLKG